MGFRLTPIFIRCQEPISEEEILNKVGLPNLEKGISVHFYDTNKQWESVYVGTKGNCIILCNGELASKAFENNNPFLTLKSAEIASIIWNETSDAFGFSVIRNGEIIRKVLVIDGEFEWDYGSPILEESLINDNEVFMAEEKEEIIEEDGEDAYNEMVRAEKVCRVVDILAKRYIGTGLLGIREGIELNLYE